MIIMGIDPGLRFNGYGVVEYQSGNFKHIVNGTFKTNEKLSLAERLSQIYYGLNDILKTYKPAEVAVEEVFVNVNPASTLKLGQARGVAILTPSLLGIPVFEYSPNLIKKSVVGVGHAGKEQIQMMVKLLLSNPVIDSEHSGDALAMAICHAHNRNSFK